MSLSEQLKIADAIREHLALMAVEDEEIITNTFEGETDIYECMDWILSKINHEAAFSDAIDSQLDKLSQRKDRANARKERLRDLLQAAMESTGQKTIKRPGATITLAPKAIGIASLNEALIPDEFFITETTRNLDKRKLKDAAINGGVVGCLLNNGGVTLRIRS